MSDDHHHEHGNGAASHLGEMDLRVRALETLLVRKGYVDPAALDRLIETYETQVGPHNGARVVARAWADPAYAAWLARDATAAIADLGYSGRQGEHMVAVFNTPDTHHMVVCTLCSCYPWPVLGLPPVWYKSAPYRSRAVIEPRGCWPSSASRCRDDTPSACGTPPPRCATWSCRMRPAGTEGWTEQQLAALVTRDSMIGTGLARNPAEATA
jgi:nitrile hydratase